jgi:hypothetical protein
MARTVKEKRTDALSELLALAEDERQTNGLAYTPSEIAQQLETWESTAALCLGRSEEIIRFLRLAVDNKTGGPSTHSDRSRHFGLR